MLFQSSISYANFSHYHINRSYKLLQYIEALSYIVSFLNNAVKLFTLLQQFIWRSGGSNLPSEEYSFASTLRTCIQFLFAVPVMICAALIVNTQVANLLIKPCWKITSILCIYTIHISILICHVWIAILDYLP